MAVFWDKAHLVGGFNHLEKYESQWEQIMCETTNEISESSSGWYTYPSEKYDFVNQDYDLPYIYIYVYIYICIYMESQKNHVPKHQPEI